MARVIFSPTTAPMLPPMNFSSIAQMLNRAAFERPGGRNQRVRQRRRVLHRRPAARCTAWRIDKVQRIGGGEPGVVLLILAVVEQDRQARPRVQLEMMLAAAGRPA